MRNRKLEKVKSKKVGEIKGKPIYYDGKIYFIIIDNMRMAINY